MAVSLPARLLARLPTVEMMVSGCILFILATIPLLFGAVHPIVQAFYTFLILAGLGGWLLYSVPEWKWQGFFRSWLLVPTLVILYMALQSVPLPLLLVDWLSPTRAERIGMLNQLAHTELTATSISENGWAGLMTVVFLFSLLLYFTTLKNLLHRNRQLLLSVVMVIVSLGLFEGIYGLLQTMNPQLGILWLPNATKAAQGTVIYKNQYAALLNMCWPLSLTGGVVYFTRSQQQSWRGQKKKEGGFPAFLKTFLSLPVQVHFFFLSAGIMMLAVIFSYSRGGILALLLILATLHLALPLSRQMKGVLTGLLFLFLAGYGSLLGFDGVIERFSTIDESGLNRFYIYASSFPLLLDHWLTGIGPGSFKLLSGVYLKEFPENLLFDRAHNEYLELAIELGLPMAIMCLGWMVSGLVVAGKKLLGKCEVILDEARDSFLIGCASLCALLGFLAHGLVDFGWRLPANSLFAVTLLALISHALHESGRGQPS